MYKRMASKYGIAWKGRSYKVESWDKSDLINQCLSSATSCLYGLTEAAILAAGYAPAIGFLHTGKPRSFVFDIADIVKFETVVPSAFLTAARKPDNPDRAVRLACRDSFRQTRLLKRLIPLIAEVLSAGGLKPPEPPTEALGPAFPDPPPLGDAGHRN